MASRQRAPSFKVGVKAGAVDPLAGGEPPIESQAGVSVAKVPHGRDEATPPDDARGELPGGGVSARAVEGSVSGALALCGQQL